MVASASGKPRRRVSPDPQSAAPQVVDASQLTLGAHWANLPAMDPGFPRGVIGRTSPGRAPLARIGRRRFLVSVAGAATYMALRPHVAWARGVARPWPQLQPWTLPDEPAPGLELVRAMIGAAVLAPSQWNTQPWRFEVEGTTIRLVADAGRALPVTDPARRGMTISLGASLEHLLIAARAYGLRPTVDYLPDEGAHGVVAQMSWTGGDSPRDRALFSAIPQRRTNRRDYDGRAVTLASSAQLMAQAPEDGAVHWLDDRGALRAIADVALEVERAQVRDRRAETERFAWMRLDAGDARRRGDGVTLDALEFGGPAHWFAGRYFDPHSRLLRFGAESAGKQARDQVRSSGALALLSVNRRSGPSWLAGGQLVARFLLKATSLGLAVQPLATVFESEPSRAEVLRRFGAGGEEPLLLVRLGHAKAPAPSYRRAVGLVATYRNS